MLARAEAARAEAELARAEAEAANQDKDEFIAVAAHELRSPLNSIAGWVQLLQTRQFDAATTLRALETIDRNTQTQVQLVEDLLDISRMRRGILHLNLAPVNLSNVIESALASVQPQATTKHIEVVTALNLVPPVSGDFNRLQQIVVNLLTNAIKFTPDCGQIEVQLTQMTVPSPQHPAPSSVQIRITDTGKGIDPAFLPRIFDRFQQGQQNLGGAKDGLGLGLAIVKNLVELHNGTITVESLGVGQGATFTVQLPLLETSAIQSESEHRSIQQPSIDVTALAGIRVLVIDDEPDQLNLITVVLESYAAIVQTANTVATALLQLPQFQPDIILSDIAMPDSSGYDLVQQIRSLESASDTAQPLPAIALTAYASTSYQERSRQAGFQRHLAKPVTPERLVAAIVDLVQGERS